MARSVKPAAKGEKGEVVPLRPSRKCPICGRPSARAFYPFDSRRCADADLAKWLGGGYAIPGEPITAVRDEEDGDG